MDRETAQRLAETATMDQIRQMMKTAQDKVKNWNKVSVGNIGLTRGVAFNIFIKLVHLNDCHILAKVNAIREFGEYFPGYAKEKRDKKIIKPAHQEPNFFDFSNYNLK